MSIAAPTPAVRGLLVSVRSASEALVALEGGAALIDVKEPDNGALGRAPNAIIAAIVAAVGGRRPVSAALGELSEGHVDALPAGLSFVKWGLAGCGASPAWRPMLRAQRNRGREVVAVAYADWQCARAPAIDDVVAFAAERPGSVVLLDTHCKEAARPGLPRPTLLDWLRPAQVVELCQHCRAAGLRIALAGSLGAAEIAALAPAWPDWFAVRGAACDGGRDGTISVDRVRELVRVMSPGRSGGCPPAPPTDPYVPD